MRPRIKICCIQSRDEAALAIEAGADALGLVSAMPSGPGVIDESTIAEVAAFAPPAIATFLLTCHIQAKSIIEQVRRTRVNTVQLCDALAPAELAQLRTALPGIKLVQVIHVRSPEAISEAAACAPAVDAILLDSGNPELAVKELGGTGRVHNWDVSREIVATCGRPVWLAGGLRPDRVAEAWARVRPFGFDVCRGLRTAGRLDPHLLDRFMREVRTLATP